MITNIMMRAVLLVSAVLITPSVNALPITITSNTIGAAASDGSGVMEDVYSGTSIPASVTISAVSGSSSSTNYINYSGNDDSATLSVDAVHSVTSQSGGSEFATTYDSILRFTANTTIDYSISGFYDVIGSSVNASLYVNFFDITSNSSLYVDFVGTTVADTDSLVLGGSLTGEIIAGHEYQFFFISSIGDNNGSNVSASATGNITLDIGTLSATAASVVAIPEPAITALLGIGLVVIGAMRVKTS